MLINKLHLKYYLFIFLSFLIFIGNAQNNEAKSKAYYFSAQEQYESKKYDSALSLLEKSEEAGGATNAYIEALRAECYVGKKDWGKAKKSLDKCFNMDPSNETLKRVSPLLLKVDEELNKEKEAEEKRILAERAAEEERLR